MSGNLKTEIESVGPDPNDGPESWHVLDFIPFQPQGDKWWGWESYLESESCYIKDFARKIVFISLTLAAEFNAEIYLKRPENYFEGPDCPTSDDDVSGMDFADLADIFYTSIVNRQLGAWIVFPAQDASLSIDGGFHVSLQDLDGDLLTAVLRLALPKGVYLKQHEDRGARVYLYEADGGRVLIAGSEV